MAGRLLHSYLNATANDNATFIIIFHESTRPTTAHWYIFILNRGLIEILNFTKKIIMNIVVMLNIQDLYVVNNSIS